MSSSPIVVQRDTRAWQLQVWVSFGIAVSLCAIGLAWLPGEQLEQWRAAKRAASEAMVGNGGTITHHHAVGRDHLPWMRAEVGESGIDLLRAAKSELDPAGIMNPGKLIPAGS